MNLNLQFKLRHPNSKGLASIYMKFYIDGQEFHYSLGQSKMIYADLWDDAKQRPIKTKGESDKEVQRRNRDLINEYSKEHPYVRLMLENVAARIDNVIMHTRNFFALCEQQNRQYNLDELRGSLDQRFGVVKKPTKKPDRVEFNEYLSQYIDDMKKGRRLTSKGNKFAKGTIKNYENFQTHLNTFQEATRKRLRFKDITLDFYDQFIEYNHRLGHGNNYIGRHIKNLKVIMRASLDEGLHDNEQFKNRKFKTIQEDVFNIYLTKEELKRLYEFEVDDPRMELSRDVFVVGCYIAQRYSDYSTIRPEHIKEVNGKKHLAIHQQKTNKLIQLPIRHELDVILAKYDYNLPKTHEQKVNKHIKELGKMVGIDEPTEVTFSKGGMVVKKVVPKYELIKTHTARRTGATLMYLSGVKHIDLMKFTGHSSVKDLLKYIKSSNLEAALRYKDNAFFTGTPLKIAK